MITIADKQLDELIDKVKNKIHQILSKEGASTKAWALSDSVSDTIRTYFKKNIDS
jgi:ribosomal silencing factor RsfS